ncbi:MAG TPA: hypothetical protein VN903_05440 [Polyangia bacterium]|jgi:hypothetical protein|nr:hypothetical protein [Polyangia bacterium]
MRWRDSGQARALSLVPLLLAGLAGCGPSATGSANGCPPGDDLCVSYCRHLFATACTWPTDFLTCVNQCHASMAPQTLPPECLDAWKAALTCGSCAMVQCAQRMCIDNGSVCIDEDSKVVGCDAESAAFRACGGACVAAPFNASTGGGSSDGRFRTSEIVTSACACPATLEPGGAPGTTCTSGQDCAQICCACAAGHGRFLIRTCQNGQCLGEAETCADGNTQPTLTTFCQG